MSIESVLVGTEKSLIVGRPGNGPWVEFGTEKIRVGDGASVLATVSVRDVRGADVRLTLDFRRSSVRVWNTIVYQLALSLRGPIGLYDRSGPYLRVRIKLGDRVIEENLGRVADKVPPKGLAGAIFQTIASYGHAGALQAMAANAEAVVREIESCAHLPNGSARRRARQLVARRLG